MTDTLANIKRDAEAVAAQWDMSTISAELTQSAEVIDALVAQKEKLFALCIGIENEAVQNMRGALEEELHYAYVVRAVSFRVRRSRFQLIR